MSRLPPTSRHLAYVGMRFLFDGMLVHLSVIIGASWRFGMFLPPKLAAYLPATMLASLTLPCLSYIGGLYSVMAPRMDGWSRLRWCFFSLLGTLVVLLGVGSISFEARLGRGVLMSGLVVLFFLYGLHHFLLSRRMLSRRLRAVCIVSGADDVMAAEILARSSPQIEVVGLVSTTENIEGSELLRSLGNLEAFEASGSLQSVKAVLVRDQHLVMPDVTSFLRRWRYQGIEIMSLADACEMVLQAVPLKLVTESWLFRASHQSGLLYIKKLKRLFDIAAALLCLMLLWPFLLLGMLAVRLSSPGPVFFKQTRMGQLGRRFVIFKLRSMHLDAEKDGPRWSSGKNDARVFPLGILLRKYRIDEIPQLFNILRGDMSFVGPRPERPEFVEQLEKVIPFYRERLLVQPGLTGWAQVKYPYGANTEDACRKHELDLYYIKHMSLLLDFFVLLETTKTVLTGGNRKPDVLVKAMHQWSKLGGAEPVAQVCSTPVQPVLPII